MQVRWADGEEQRLGLTNVDIPNAKLFIGKVPPQTVEVTYWMSQMNIFNSFVTGEHIGRFFALWKN